MKKYVLVVTETEECLGLFDSIGAIESHINCETSSSNEDFTIYIVESKLEWRPPQQHAKWIKVK